ncbi:MAG: hypothetical protein M0011_14805 [Elusimicrobia bacterium]|nr:hypothetical protein [Elusimicrobiota bacterium]
MGNSSNNRKIALIVSVLAFLFAGGGVFLFFVIQGSNDLTGKNGKNSFSYGFSVRDAVTPLFKTLGISTYDDEMKDAAVKRLEARGVTPPNGAPSSSPDISDWMAKDGSRASASAPASRPSAPTNISKMAQKSMSGVGGLGGAGSKSSAGLTRFGEGSESGETSVSASAHAGKAGAADKGTLASLKNARALLSQGLQSGSAMTARDKWNQSFGVGGAKSATGGQLAYNKSGLVSLDKIKSGEIENLKMDKANTFGAPDVPKMEKAAGAADIDQDPNKKKDAEAQMKSDIASALTGAAGNALTNSGSKPGDLTTASADHGDPNKPPESVVAMGSNQKPPEGKYCPDGCPTADGGGTYKDNQAQYDKCDGGWCVTYSGTQTDANGNTFTYSDTMKVNPGGDPPFTPVSSTANGKPVDFGGGP